MYTQLYLRCRNQGITGNIDENMYHRFYDTQIWRQRECPKIRKSYESVGNYGYRNINKWSPMTLIIWHLVTHGKCYFAIIKHCSKFQSCSFSQCVIARHIVPVHGRCTLFSAPIPSPAFLTYRHQLDNQQVEGLHGSIYCIWHLRVPWLILKGQKYFSSTFIIFDASIEHFSFVLVCYISLLSTPVVAEAACKKDYQYYS